MKPRNALVPIVESAMALETGGGAQAEKDRPPSTRSARPGRDPR
jgi:hypothetical protein